MRTTEVHIGKVTIGGDNPIAIQSMTNTPTIDTEASVAQCIALAKSGADIIRLTAQTPKHARNLLEIRKRFRAAGYSVPLVADIHFDAEAAMVAAECVEKIRINPGNFVDPARTFVKLSYTDAEYAAELERLRAKFVPLLNVCKEHRTALRLGVNHGSLSDRIMSRYGDTPAGMVESAMEFLRICVAEDFSDVVISIKASNVVVMTQTVRLMAQKMREEGLAFPLHLGVTEAGAGEDARIKSAVGIGSLLADGIGDTIRVSLSEDPCNEIGVGRMIVEYANTKNTRQHSRVGLNYGSVASPQGAVWESVGLHHGAAASPQGADGAVLMDYSEIKDFDRLVIAASIDFGSLLLKRDDINYIGIVSGFEQSKVKELLLGILQATRRRISKTEYIACPGCGRTLFDLQTTLAQVQAATSGYKNLKIAVMGCIVNGPGEMADADYGYVGAGRGRVSIYRNKECLYRNVPTEEALPKLIDLIEKDRNEASHRS